MQEVSEGDSFAFRDWESDICHKILHQITESGLFMSVYMSSVFVVGTKTSKTGLVCMVSEEHNFITEDLHLPHKPQAFFSCFGQDAALKNP